MPKLFNTLPVEKRITYKIDDNGCWLWTRGLTSHGYAEIWIDKKRYKVHRYMYEQKYGKIKAGLVCDHLCRVRRCINPDHIEPVTIRENVLRGIGIVPENAYKTHCINGHEFTDSNTRLSKGKRYCRACSAIYYQNNRAKLKGVSNG